MLRRLSSLVGLPFSNSKKSKLRKKEALQGKSLGGMERLEDRLLLNVDWSTKPHDQRDGPNLAPNHDFDGLGAYRLLNGAVYDASVTRTAGSGSVKLLNDGDRVYTTSPSSFIPVTPGETYTFSAYTKTTSAAAPFPTIQMGVAFRDANGNWLANATVPSRWSNSKPNTWEEMTSFIEVPDQVGGTPVERLGFSLFQGDDTDGVSRTAWVDDIYVGLGEGFEQAPSPKTAFDGKQTRVDELGNIEVLRNGTWEPFFPLAIYGDGTRPDWSPYSDQGFNMNMWSSVTNTVNKAAAVGMMSGIDISSFIIDFHANYGNVSLLESRIADFKAQGVMDDIALFYWDNEQYDEWDVPVAITDAVKAADVDGNGNRLHPIYSLNGQNGLGRRYQNNQAHLTDITGTYIGGDNGAPRGRTDNLRILDNIENQQQPAVFAQINRGVGIEMRPRLFGAIAHGAKGMGMWRDYHNHPTEAPVEQLDWWGDFPNITGEINQMLDAGLIQVPHWTEWSLDTPTDGIDFGTRDLNGEGYVIAANYNDSNTTTTFTLNGLGYVAAEVRDFFTGNLVATVSGNQFTVTMGANSSGVYRLVAGPSGDPTNLVVNPSFENGATGWSEVASSQFPGTSVWNGTWGTANEHTGSHAYATSNQAYGTLQSDQFPVTANTNYDVHAYLRGELDPDDSAGGWIVRAEFFNSSGTSIGIQNAASGSSLNTPNWHTWKQEGGAIQTPAGTATMRVQLYNYLNSGWVAFDDVSVLKNGTGSNLVPNASFENGETSWSEVVRGDFPATSIWRSSWGPAEGHLSTHSYVIGNQAYGYLQSDSISAIANTNYDVHAYIRGEIDPDDSHGGWIVRAEFHDSNGAYLGFKDAASATSLNNTSWQKMGGTVQSLPGTATMRIQLYNYLTSGWVAYDDVTVLKNGTGSNLIGNESFENGETGWTEVVRGDFPATSIWRSTWGTADGRTGSYGYAISNHAYGYLESDPIQISAGSQYNLDAFVRGEQDVEGSFGSGKWYVRARFYNSSGAKVGSDQFAASSSLNTLTSDWQQVGKVITAPSGAQTIRILLHHYLSSGWVAYDDVSLTAVGGAALLAAETSTELVGQTLENTSGQFELLVDAASAYWLSQGADAKTIARIDFRVADLSGNLLGFAQGSTVWIDSDAAGHGWYLDRTPWDDIEFGRQTSPEGMDLLTVLAHEMGHTLGLGHDEGVMAERLDLGERHLERTYQASDFALLAWLYGDDSDDEPDKPWRRYARR